MNFLTSQLFYFSLLAAGLLLCLYLIVSLKRETAGLARRLREERESAGSALDSLRAELAGLRQSLAGRELGPAEPGADTPAPPLSINLDKRRQALRLYRRGESPGQIAATLHMARKEVELLLKVHQTLLNQT